MVFAYIMVHSQLNLCSDPHFYDHKIYLWKKGKAKKQQQSADVPAVKIRDSLNSNVEV